MCTSLYFAPILFCDNSNIVVIKSILSFSVIHYMLCMIGSAIFILHSITLSLFLKHPMALCKRKRDRSVAPSDVNGEVPQSKRILEESEIPKKDENGGPRTWSFICVKCSFIYVSDIASFIVCLILNLAGYSLLASTYRNGWEFLDFCELFKTCMCMYCIPFCPNICQ